MSDLMSKGELFNKLATVQTLGEAYGVIQALPTVDAVEVVRCADCIRYHSYDEAWGWCAETPYRMRKKDYCSYGVRKDGGDEQTKKPE